MRFHAAVVAAAAAVIASVGGGGFPPPGLGATGPTPTLIAASYPGSVATWPPSGTDEEAGVGASSEQHITSEGAHPSRNLADPARSAPVDTSTASVEQHRDGGHSCPTTTPARTSGRIDDDSGGSVQTLLGAADSDTKAEAARDTAAARVPGDLIDLADWYLTLPTGKQGDPDTVENPDLAKFTNEFFTLDDTGEAVVFSARGDGVTTKNSHYPRSELREMTGSEKVSWSNTIGTHTLDVCEAIIKVPAGKPEVVAAQIHNASDDVLQIRLEGQKLMVQYDDGKSEQIINPGYTLGTPYHVRIVAADSKVDVLYDGEKKAELPLNGSGWYFKVGAYVQANGESGDANSVGAVAVYALNVDHGSGSGARASATSEAATVRPGNDEDEKAGDPKPDDTYRSGDKKTGREDDRDSDPPDRNPGNSDARNSDMQDSGMEDSDDEATSSDGESGKAMAGDEKPDDDTNAY